jgi:hypothetical protein
MCIDWSVKATDIAIVFATLVGPVLAIWASEWRQKNRQNQERKEWVFRTLMTTRSARLHPDHIQALNYIAFAFADQPKIVDAWGLYFAHLNTDQGTTQDSNARWHDKSNTLLAELLHQMATHLNIAFSKTDIAQPSYYPRGYEMTEADQQELRKLLLQVLRNERSINMNATVYSPPRPPNA